MAIKKWGVVMNDLMTNLSTQLGLGLDDDVDVPDVAATPPAVPKATTLPAPAPAPPPAVASDNPAIADLQAQLAAANTRAANAETLAQQVATQVKDNDRNARIAAVTREVSAFVIQSIKAGTLQPANSTKVSAALIQAATDDIDNPLPAGASRYKQILEAHAGFRANALMGEVLTDPATGAVTLDNQATAVHPLGTPEQQNDRYGARSLRPRPGVSNGTGR
jgi:hypothetical protein